MPPRRLSDPSRFPGLGLAPCEVRELLRDGHRAGERAIGWGVGLPDPADPDGALRAITPGGVPIFGPLLAAAETAGRLRLLVLTDRRLLTVRRAARARRAVAEQEVPLGEARVGVERLGRASGRTRRYRVRVGGRGEREGVFLVAATEGAASARLVAGLEAVAGARAPEPANGHGAGRPARYAPRAPAGSRAATQRRPERRRNHGE